MNFNTISLVLSWMIILYMGCIDITTTIIAITAVGAIIYMTGSHDTNAGVRRSSPNSFRIHVLTFKGDTIIIIVPSIIIAIIIR